MIKRFYKNHRVKEAYDELLPKVAVLEQAVARNKKHLEMTMQAIRQVLARRHELPSWVSKILDEAIEAVPKVRGGRRPRPIPWKDEIAKEFLNAPRGSRAAVARKHGISTTAAWTWAKDFLDRNDIPLPEKLEGWNPPPRVYKPPDRVEFGAELSPTPSDYEMLRRDLLDEVDDV